MTTPWCFIGPSGSGKISLARRWIEEMHGVRLDYPMEVRTFSVGDGYEARVLTSPYHFEIDIPNLSMQDKQIIGELLTMFLSSSDVLNSLTTASRKLVILRRAHCLSLPAAIRVRAILQQYVLPANAPGMIWITTREMTGALSLLEDAFVRYRVPRMSLQEWQAKESVPVGWKTEEAWRRLEGRPERARQMEALMGSLGTSSVWPRRIQDFYDEMVAMMLRGAAAKVEPTLDVITWIRGRVYEALSFCQTGPEIIDSCAAAMTRCVDNAHMTPDMFFGVMRTLAESEPHTSYRTPLSLEWALLSMYEVMRSASLSTPTTEDARAAVATAATKNKTTVVRKTAAVATATANKTATAATDKATTRPKTNKTATKAVAGTTCDPTGGIPCA